MIPYELSSNRLWASLPFAVFVFGNLQWPSVLRWFAIWPTGGNLCTWHRWDFGEHWCAVHPMGSELVGDVSETRNDLMLIKITPPVIGQRYGLGGQDIEYLIIATRYSGTTLFPITEYPIYVHVARLVSNIPPVEVKISTKDLEPIAWAELYRTKEEAEKKGSVSAGDS